MKKIFLMLLAISVVVCSLVSCSGNDKDASLEDTTAETIENNDTEEESQVDMVYSDGLIIEVYLPVVAMYFYDNFDSEDNILEKDLFHLAAQFIYTQRTDLISRISEDETTFDVRASDIENVVKALFGGNISIEDISGYMNAELGDSYDEERGMYTFSADIISYAPDGYILSYDDEMDIKDEGRTVIAKATLLDAEQNKTQITYTFEKVLFNGYMFTKLIKAEK